MDILKVKGLDRMKRKEKMRYLGSVDDRDSGKNKRDHVEELGS